MPPDGSQGSTDAARTSGVRWRRITVRGGGNPAEAGDERQAQQDAQDDAAGEIHLLDSWGGRVQEKYGGPDGSTDGVEREHDGRSRQPELAEPVRQVLGIAA